MPVKMSKKQSLIYIMKYLIISIFAFGIGVMFIIQLMGFDEITKALIGSQLSIAFFGLTLFNFNIEEIKKIFNKKFQLKHIFHILLITFSVLLFNAIMSIITEPFIKKEVPGITEDMIRSTSVLGRYIIPVILAPLIEELAFRAGLKRILVDNSKWTPIQFVLLSSILFGILHWQPVANSLLYVLIITGAGFLWGYAYIKTNNIYVSIFSHILYNQIILFGASLLL